jgi:hypothetical protein
MFDSVAGAIVPICILSALTGFACSYLRRWWLTALLAVILPVAIAYAWFWLPQFIAPLTSGDNPDPWDLIATSYWSLFAVPVSVASVVLARLFRAKMKRYGA